MAAFGVAFGAFGIALFGGLLAVAIDYKVTTKDPRSIWEIMKKM